MKAMGILILKLTVFGVVYLCWRVTAYHTFSFWPAMAVVWGGLALAPLVALGARWLLNRKPTAERAAELTLLVHFLEGLLLGCGLIVGYSAMGAHPWVKVPFPRAISQPVMEVVSIFSALTVLNLAVRGLGLPFAVVLSHRLATDWLYRRCRNPMVLSVLLFCLCGAVWMQSLHAIVWVLCWLTPAWVLFVHLYEERELEIRFGSSYVEYKAKTPFFM